MSDIVSYLTANWSGIVAVLVAAVYAAEKVAALTSSKSDDAIVAKVEEVLKNLNVVPGDKPKA